jgi:hypothetical protein
VECEYRGLETKSQHGSRELTAASATGRTCETLVLARFGFRRDSRRNLSRFDEHRAVWRVMSDDRDNDYTNGGDETRIRPRGSDPPTSSRDDSMLAGVAYATVSARLRQPPHLWNEVEVRAADNLWERLRKHDAKCGPLSAEVARVFAEQNLRYAQRDAYRDIIRGGDRRPPPIVFTDELRIPTVTQPDTTFELAASAELARELDRVTKHQSDGVNEIASLIQAGLKFAEIDAIRGKPAGSSYKQWSRTRDRLARALRRFLGDNP